MENRSHAMLAGLFTLVFLVAAAVAAIWISKKNVPLKLYELVASSPVTGLSIQSQVRYQGVPVGRVQSLRFIEDKPGQVRILIGVDPKAPVTEATWAEIVTTGVTGISNVELRDNGSSSVRLNSSPEHLAEIPIKPSFLERLQSQGGGMLASVERVLAQVEKITNDENLASITTSLKNTARLTENAALLTERLNRSVEALEPGLKKFPKVMDGLSESINKLNAPNGPMQQATLSLRGIQEMVAQLRVSTLPDLTALSVSVTDAARAFTLTSRQLGQSPQSLIFGLPRAAAGPGEAGFAGFAGSAGSNPQAR
jgi:phospholipid/cholesterol/gamma-HCH transport system substrate-binding protein